MRFPLKAEIISIGTELLLGRTVNSDAAIIARSLSSLGIDLHNIQMVGDNPGRVADALKLAASRSQIIITSGGLGPTDDDLTKSVVAKFTGRPLVEYPEAQASIRDYFGSRPMSANQARQTFFPQGSTLFPNSVGTAPGCATPLHDGYVILLPGPPGELAAMLEASVIPFLSSLSDTVISSVDVRTFGIGEGAAAELVRDLMQADNPSVAPYASEGEMFLRVTARAANEAEANALCAPLVREIRARLGDVVYGLNVPSLEAVVLELLKAAKMTVATAESCTGGLLAKRLTDLPGSSAVFNMGLVTYSNRAKEQLLKIPGELVERQGAVSAEVANAMAANMKKLAGSDFAIGITGIAGPDGATSDKPLGLVYIALAGPERIWLRQMRSQGRYPGRAFIRNRASSVALDMLRRALTGLPVPE